MCEGFLNIYFPQGKIRIRKLWLKNDCLGFVLPANSASCPATLPAQAATCNLLGLRCRYNPVIHKFFLYNMQWLVQYTKYGHYSGRQKYI